MMYAQVGNVLLKVIDLTRFDRETVWTDDHADLLSIRQTVGFVATYAPGGYPRMPSAMALSDDTTAVLEGGDRTAVTLDSFHRGRDPGIVEKVRAVPFLETDDVRADGPVFPIFERAGPETDAELRLRLLQPRQKFILWAYARQTGRAIRWLESPRPGFSTDLGNGPKPLSCDIVSASGEPNSVAMHYQIQTETSPCPVGSDRLVLSHRWEMSHGYDENYYLTRTTIGTIVFNGAVMRHQSVRPDFVRAQFIHPIPLGFKRGVPRITQSSDGLTIRYVITDTDPTITFSPGNSGATSIQIIEKLLLGIKRAIPDGL